MEINFDQFAAGAANRYQPADAPDDTSTATPQAGVFVAEIDDEPNELTVRFDFEPMTADEATKIAVVHTHLLSKMHEAFIGDFVAFDNKGAKLSARDIDPIHLTPVKHQSRFNIHVSQRSKNRRPKYTIIHRIHTSQSLSTIRTYNSVNAVLKEHHCYLKNHAWAETDWDVAQVGFLIGISPQYYTPDMATKFVSDFMVKKGLSNCPPIRLIASSPHIVNPIDGKIIRSKAYAVEFERKNARDILRCFKDAFTGTTTFLMAKLRYSHPTSFAKALRIQNKLLNETYAIPLINISPKEFFYLQNSIESTAGVIAMLPTRRSLTTGRYNILTKATDFKTVRADIIAKFPSYYDQVCPNEQQKPDAYLFHGPPGISALKDTDDASSGAQSFLSTSAASFASFSDLSESTNVYENFPSANNTYSWSDVAKRNSSNIPNEVSTPVANAKASHAAPKATPSPAASAVPPHTTDDIDQLRVEYEAKFQSNRDEIAELKQMLSQMMSALNNLGAQGLPTNIADPTNLSPPTEPDVRHDQNPTTPLLKRNGSTSPPSQPDPSRHKRLDHKPSPAKTKPDFVMDE
jgi:hypothetical protein